MDEIAIGEILDIVINFDGFQQERHATDPNVGISAEFFVKGKRNKGVVEVAKKDLVPIKDGDCNIFNCHLDTTDLPTGQLVAEFYISYPCELHGEHVRLKSKPYFEYPNILVVRE